MHMCMIWLDWSGSDLMHVMNCCYRFFARFAQVLFSHLALGLLRQRLHLSQQLSQSIHPFPMLQDPELS